MKIFTNDMLQKKEKKKKETLPLNPLYNNLDFFALGKYRTNGNCKI